MTNALLFICFLLILIVGYGQTSVDPVKLRETIDLIEHSQSSEASRKLKQFLNDNPQPTKSEFSKFRNEIDPLLILNASRKVTRNDNLTAKKPEELTTEENNLELDLPGRVGFTILILAFFTLAVLRFIRYVRNDK